MRAEGSSGGEVAPEGIVGGGYGAAPGRRLTAPSVTASRRGPVYLPKKLMLCRSISKLTRNFLR